MKQPIVIGSDGIMGRPINPSLGLPPLGPEYFGACITWHTDFLELPNGKNGPRRQRYHQK